MVSVVVKDRKDGAGEENILSAPLLVLGPPAVAVVPVADVVKCDCAASEFAASGSVDNVGATDLFPIVGAWIPSMEERNDFLLRFSDDVLTVRPVGVVEKERR